MLPIDPQTLLPTTEISRSLADGTATSVDLLLEAFNSVDDLIVHTSSSNTGAATVGAMVDVTGLTGKSETTQFPITLVAEGVTTLTFIVEEPTIANYTMTIQLTVTSSSSTTDGGDGSASSTLHSWFHKTFLQ
eukprot:TRINITY_DN2377_c0_g1_i2.p1 TRINITY_DN2377_c0_g1~~TRINITY_DN2377_c0_g1_i2.p1  ORF type:complete len:133 (-),score=23.17 TRINITY_DN2377_c0_g1_i2:19-417(-)